MRKIVVLDGYTLNPGDLSWDKVAELGELEAHDRTLPEETIARAKGAEIVLTNKVALSRETISKLPDLKYIGVLATGYNLIDVKAAAEKGIVVSNVPVYGTKPVAQMTFSHILNLAQRVACNSKAVKKGKWSESKDFCYLDYPTIELDSLSIGIVGFGRIGQAVASLAKAFGMKILAYNAGRKKIADNVEFVKLDELFQRSDIVSLHCPLNSETEKIVNGEKLSLMKKTAFLVNTSRGGLIDESELADALNSGRIAGAGLDVLSTEPPEKSNPLLAAENCFITPHIAWATKAARERLMRTSVENIKAFLNGSPQNIASAP